MRIFFAIPLDIKTQTKLASLHNYRKSEAISERIISKENLHITVTFIGEVENVSQYIEVLDNVKLHDFDVQTNNEMQYFRDTLVISIQKNNNLLLLKQTIDSLLKDKNLLPEKKYSYLPHITLARKTRGEIFKNPILDFCVDKVVLYQSILSGNNVEYRIIKEVSLLKE